MSQQALFDPHCVPVWQEATAHIQQQSPVRQQALTMAALQQRFAQPPAWSPEPRHEHYPQAQRFRPAAVLIGLQPEEPEEAGRPAGLRVVLTRRTPHLSSHAGQIAFPGGKIDAADAGAAAAALRETHEEIGLEPATAQVLGELPLYVTGTGYQVTPVVALLPPQARFEPNPHEVDEVFAVPLDFLMNPLHHRKHQWQLAANHRREWFSMPYVEPQTGRERYIWGVTAGILRDFYRFLSA